MKNKLLMTLITLIVLLLGGCGPVPDADIYAGAGAADATRAYYAAQITGTAQAMQMTGTAQADQAAGLATAMAATTTWQSTISLAISQAWLMWKEKIK